MEFNSQAATSIEQSKRLLELGLRNETADMYYTNAGLPFIKDEFHLECKSFKKLSNNLSEISPFTFIPAWSLDRLRELLVKAVSPIFIELLKYKLSELNYDLLIDVISDFKKLKKFNPKYLEESK